MEGVLFNNFSEARGVLCANEHATLDIELRADYLTNCKDIKPLGCQTVILGGLGKKVGVCVV